MPPRTKNLFISYRSSDAVKVDKIARDLSLLQYEDGVPRYTTWQDKHNLPPASPHWWDAIVDAIIECDMFVFHISRASLQSEVCRAELDYAHKRNRPIIPIVLDGEYFLDAKSGKYNIAYWELVPEWLGERQFLFYAGTEFYGRFVEAVAGFERNWPRDISAPRPLNPDSKSVHGSNHALYSAACDYAERLALTDAEKHFDALVRRNDEDYADLAAQWLDLIRRYAELVEIVEHRSPAVVFKRKWTAYQALFPNDLVEGIFDPRGFAARATGSTAPEPAPVVQVAPPNPVTPPPAPSRPQPAKPTSLTLLPSPFGWIEIPSGRGTMKMVETSVTLSISTEKYWISKYPITNAQFAKFIDAGGYREKRWWTNAGWAQREKDGCTQPRYWADGKWNDPEQPVVGVSWYEAVAFCLWLSKVSGERIMLPTEAQWQFAAQGIDGRACPWGNDWDGTRCNNNVDQKGIGQTTPVRAYEGKGDSPFGVVDMAGNVWEWCLTDYNQKTNDVESQAAQRVLRGGSWDDLKSERFRCDYRNRGGPHLRNYFRGFRIALPSSSEC